MKKLLFICDPLSYFHIKTDTTYLLMLNAGELGFEIFYALPKDVFSENEIAKVNANKLNILANLDNYKNPPLPWFEETHTVKNVNLNDFNAVLVRNDPPFNMEYYYLTHLLSLAENQGTRVINNSNALRTFNEKLSILNFPDLIAPTMVTKNHEVILGFLDKYPHSVIKPLDLMAGRSVFKLSKDDPNCNTIIETITNYGTQSIMVQQFIPEVKFGDRRIFIVDGEVISHCLHRIPSGNNIRGNIAAGGRGEVHPISDAEFKLAAQVAIWLKQQRVILAGIDVIGNKLTEINITSPTGTRQLMDYADINISKMILQKLISVLE